VVSIGKQTGNAENYKNVILNRIVSGDRVPGRSRISFNPVKQREFPLTK
jgi:hypothetical protein